MSLPVQVCPYHDRLQHDVNGLAEIMVELREWKAAQEERQKNLEAKLDQAVAWMKWAVGLSISTAVALLGAVAALMAGRW